MGRKRQKGASPECSEQTHPGFSAFAPFHTSRLWLSFNIFWITRNALTLLYFLLRNGSLFHLGAALMEILCLRKDRGGKKPTTFPIIGKMGGKKVIPGLSLEEKKSLLRGSCQLVLLCCILWFHEKWYCLFYAEHKWLSTKVGVFNTKASLSASLCVPWPRQYGAGHPKLVPKRCSALAGGASWALAAAELGVLGQGGSSPGFPWCGHW